MKTFHLIVFSLLMSFASIGQKGETLFGLQYKPVIPNRLIGFYEQEFNQSPFESTVKQKYGHAASMLIRIGINDKLAVETGLGFTQRNYDLNFAHIDSGYTATGDVRVVSYSLPAKFLVFIRLSDMWYMNTALGAAMTMFPSDVQTTYPISLNENFQQEGAYRSKVQGAALANVGFECRTKSKGTFYFGGAYHLPFIPIMTFAMSYEHISNPLVSIDNIRGSFLTADIRYYFPENKKDKK
ncbi:hypothetical protein K6119_17120 [Paracrocinitomix mangrovi]|uniref:hypothetical protein n=1 Tax=Paracrocinitomix mangrovi TaxID=2862509 RepID=UPI001C8DE7FF|nr:hypothetical protein [Paracrocinitomix mangrovi]UKN01449.1 hypothetical protein K6119_17120 [Paracrocinitomix mangrovi]